MELHWRFSKENQFSTLDYNYLLNVNTVTTINIGNHVLPVIPDPLNFIYTCYHAEFHYCERLHWMIDTLHYANQMHSTQWEVIFEDSKKYEVEPHLHYLIKRWKTFFPSLSKLSSILLANEMLLSKYSSCIKVIPTIDSGEFGS